MWMKYLIIWHKAKGLPVLPGDREFGQPAPPDKPIDWFEIKLLQQINAEVHLVFSRLPVLHAIKHKE